MATKHRTGRDGVLSALAVLIGLMAISNRPAISRRRFSS
jgi:hypothetical protein